MLRSIGAKARPAFVVRESTGDSFETSVSATFRSRRTTFPCRSFISYIRVCRANNAGAVVVEFCLLQSPGVLSAGGQQLCGGEGFALANYYPLTFSLVGKTKGYPYYGRIQEGGVETSFLVFHFVCLVCWFGQTATAAAMIIGSHAYVLTRLTESCYSFSVIFVLVFVCCHRNSALSSRLGWIRSAYIHHYELLF